MYVCRKSGLCSYQGCPVETDAGEYLACQDPEPWTCQESEGFEKKESVAEVAVCE